MRKLSINLPDTLFESETLLKMQNILQESASAAEGKKGRTKYMNILNFVKKTATKSSEDHQPVNNSLSFIFERPLARTDLSYPLPRHPIYVKDPDIESFLQQLLNSELHNRDQEVALAMFYQRCSDKQKDQPTAAITQPHLALRKILLNNDVDLATASKVRRVFFGFFETPETLRFLATYSPGSNIQQLQQFINAKARGELFIPAKNDAKIITYYEERTRYVQQRIKELQRYYNEVKPIEEKGFTRGVASIFMASRVFFGHHFVHSTYSRIDPCNPFAIEDGIDYDCETCGFDQSTSLEESSSDRTDDNNAELQNLNLPEDYNEDLDQKASRILDNDDLESSEEANLADGASIRFLDKERALRYIMKQADRFTWPVPVYTPDSIAGAKPTYTFSSSFWKGCVCDDKATSSITQNSDHENSYGIILATEEDFSVFKPIFLQGFST